MLHVHNRSQEEQNSGIGYVHHIVVHTINHPETCWFDRCVLFVLRCMCIMKTENFAVTEVAATLKPQVEDGGG